MWILLGAVFFAVGIAETVTGPTPYVGMGFCFLSLCAFVVAKLDDICVELDGIRRKLDKGP